MYGLRGVTLLLCSIAVQSILAQDDGIVFNPPLDPDSKNNFNYLDRLNVSVLPYRPRTDPKVLLACLSNKTGADGARKSFFTRSLDDQNTQRQIYDIPFTNRFVFHL